MLVGAVAFTGCGPGDGNNGNNGTDAGIDGGDVEMDGGDVEEDTDVDPGDPAALSADSSLLEFGSVAVDSSSSSTLTVTNDGEQASSAISVSIDGDDFELSDDGCDGTELAGGDSCDIEVTFTPSAEGDLTGDLAISADDGGDIDVTLEGTGLGPESLSIDPPTGEFDDTIVDETSATTDFTVTNNGGVESGELTVSLSGGDSTQFSIESDDCDANTLAGGATCTISVAFAPQTTGSKSTELTVVGTNQQGAVSAALSGTAINDASLEFDDATNDFGSAVEGTDGSSFTYTLENTGDVDTGSITVTTGGDDSQFTIDSSDCDSAVLTPGGTCVIEAQFTPGTEGDYNATISASATPGGDVEATATGEALAPSDLSINPQGPVDFGPLTEGTTGSTELLTVTNNGGSATGNLSVATTGDATHFTVDSSDCSNSSLAAGGSCQITAAFSPNTAGTFSASVTVTDPNTGSAVVTLEGVGEAQQAPAALELTPATGRNFGSVPTGENSATRDLTITNSGDQTSGSITIDRGGNNLSQFEIVSDDCPSTGLPGGDTCSVTTRFTPTSNTLGDKTATVEISASPGGTDSAPLRGTQIAPAALAATSTPGVFPSVIIGSQTSTADAVITNNGDDATDTLSTNAGSLTDFEFVSDGCDGNTLASGASCTISVRFNPTVTGDLSETLTVEDTGNSLTVDVTLEGESLEPYTLELTQGNLDLGDYDGADCNGSPGTCSSTFTVTNTEDDSNGDAAIGATDRQFDVSLADSVDTGSNGVVDTPFLLSDGCGSTTVAAGSTCTITVTFSPDESSAPGLREDTLSVTDSVDSVTEDRDIEATWLGTTGGDLNISPSPYSFDTVAFGTSETQTFTVTNVSNASTDPLSVTLSVDTSGTNTDDIGIVSNDCEGATLAAFNDANDSCEIQVRFFPTDPGVSVTPPVNLDASLTAEYGTTPTTVTATITGQGDDDVSLTGPSSVSFEDTSYPVDPDDEDPIPASQDTAVQTVTITNNGNIESGTLSVTWQGGNSSIFTKANDGCDGDSLEESGGANTCEIDIDTDTDFNTSLGDYEATLVIDDGQGNTVNVTVETTVASAVTVSQGATSDVAETGNDTKDTDTDGLWEFDNTRVGETSAFDGVFTITNLGDADISISNFALPGADFNITDSDGCAGTLAASGGVCELNVKFEPTTASDLTGTLSFEGSGGAADNATIGFEGTGTQVSLVFLAEPSRDFGSTVAGSGDGYIRSFKLKNEGNTAADGGLISTVSGNSNADFDLTDNCDGTGSLAAGGTCTIEAKFTPSSAGSKQVTISVEEDGTSFSAPLTLTGEGLASDGLVISPSTVEFDTNLVAGEDTGSTVTFTVENTTNSNVSALSASIGGTDAADFCYGDNCSTSVDDLCTGDPLGAGDTCTIEVTYVPQSAGADKSATLNVSTSSSGVSAGVAQLTGSAISPASLSASPTSTDFGNASATPNTVNRWVDKTFTLTNSGEQAITDLGVADDDNPQLGTNNTWFEVLATGSDCLDVDGSGSTDPLTQGESCDLVVRFRPMAIASASGEFTISPDVGGDVTLNFTGEGVEQATLEITPDPDPVDCGTEAAESETVCETFDVSNNGGVDTAKLTTISVSGGILNTQIAQSLKVTDNGTCAVGDVIPANDSCSVQVEFTPPSIGSYEWDLTVTDDSDAGSGNADLTDTVTLEGQAVSALSSDATDGEVNFGSVADGDMPTADIEFTNASGTPTTDALNVSSTGGDFKVLSSTCYGVELAAGDSCTVTVEYASDGNGASGSVTVTDGTSNKTSIVELNGNGGGS